MTVDAFPSLKWNGVIAEISPEANRQKATVQVKMQIKNPDEHLRPDMNATVKFLADDNKGGNPQARRRCCSLHRRTRSRRKESRFHRFEWQGSYEDGASS